MGGGGGAVSCTFPADYELMIQTSQLPRQLWTCERFVSGRWTMRLKFSGPKNIIT